MAVLLKGASISQQQQKYSEDDLRDVIDLMRSVTGESVSTTDAILVSAMLPAQECLNFCQQRRKELVGLDEWLRLMTIITISRCLPSSSE